jgi:glycosyltransferase involved in cell wall biosynthesis
MNGLVSFVVDGIAEHYYKAELLLFSLKKFGGVPRNRILVQCVDRVSKDFLAFLQQRGYNHRLVAPFLDSKYCNKLQQLEGIETYLADADGAYLLDIDMAVLAPFSVPDNQAICGKIVDIPNPPLHVLERIFSTAGIGLPAFVSPDCDQGMTLATNFNGGFLFIPRNLIGLVSGEWRRWASWLYQRPGLFDSPQQFIHVDQVAISMAIAARSLPFVQLSSNYNFPVHQKTRPTYFLKDQPIRILHYHRNINPDGMIFSSFPDGDTINNALAPFNAALTEQGRFAFFDGVKRQQTGTNPIPANPPPSISRNQPCPCGSGKRYKHCCGSAGESGAPLPPASGLGDKMRMALQNQMAGKLSIAEEFYREALELDPHNIDALHMLGVVCLERLRYAEALELMLRAAELSHWAIPHLRLNFGLVISRSLAGDANARQAQLLARHIEWKELLSSRIIPAPKPLVSVIVPSYNHAGYISQALASVFGQTYRDIELVVIDDGSTDGSPAIIGKLLEGCPFPHRFIARENRGAERTLNEGAELSLGSFLAFLNSDDCFAPDRIWQMVDNIAARGAQWGFSGVTYFDHRGAGIDSTHPVAQSHLRSTSNTLGKISNSFAFIEFNPCISTGNLFVEKSLFQRIGGFRMLRYNHDWDFCLRASILSEPVLVEAPLYRYRLHGKNTISESAIKTKAEADKVFTDYYQSLETVTTAENDQSPFHADNRTLLYKLGLGNGHGELLPIDRLRSIGAQLLSDRQSHLIPRSHATPHAATRKQALVVLGMHRSGTSALTRVLNLCGAFLPDNKRPAKLNNNDKGFWEPEEIIHLNERLLKSFGATSLDAQFNLADKMYLHADFIDDAAMLLKSEYGGQPLILIKDPRMCLFARWWDEAIHKAGYEPCYVIPLRNPLEVAASLEARDSLPMEAGLALWLHYFNEADAATRESRRVFATYTDMMSDWRRCLSRISTALDIKFDTDGNAREIDIFLEDRLRRQMFADESLFDLPPTPIHQAIKEKYRWALQQASAWNA